MTLMKIIEHDVILVNKLTEASSLVEMAGSFIRYITLKDPASPKNTDDQNKQTKKDTSKKPKKATKREKDETSCRRTSRSMGM